MNTSTIRFGFPIFSLLCALFAFNTAFAGSIKIDRVDPPNWWVGMPGDSVTLLIHGEGVGAAAVSLKHDGVSIRNRTTTENPNYLLLTLNVAPKAAAGEVELRFKNGRDKGKFNYPIQKRSELVPKALGLDQSDLVYLIMPDRFANGNPENDIINGSQETVINRDSMFYRHGGDLAGIVSKLDYLQDLGVTALWLNPVLANDQPKESYHGYAATDHYRTDPRICTTEEYKAFVVECHRRGMKVVMDVVHNHVGDRHWWYQDLIAEDWIHRFPEYTRTNFRATTLIDPYASAADKNLMSDGWFDHHMPDLNQKNPWLATYFIQNNLWWVEYAGIDAYRIDTYAYPDKVFMSKWNKAMKSAYPNITLFGETWVHGQAIQAWFTEGNGLDPDLNNELSGVTDFQIYYAINDAMEKEEDWTGGVSKIYYALVKDYLYKDPTRNVIFLDNHDLSRFYSMAQEDIGKFKMGVGLLMTLRGIPQLYYGTEILMKNYADPDGKVREDFPGGWSTDTLNKFTEAGRTAPENEAFNYVRTLAKWRAANPAITQGKTMQFVPKEGVYTFFRYTDNRAVMVIVNGNKTKKKVDTSRYAERLKGFSKAIDPLTGNPVTDYSALTVPAKTTLILDLMP
ncbi:MAG: glycoside hydrolase family 13 protein [Salibacteraceae bacterium]